MTENQWEKFVTIRENFKSYINECSNILRTENTVNGKKIKDIQKELADTDGVPDYPLENEAVYNTALDSLTKEDSVKLIVVGDNPGKSEQLNKNRRYLIGQSGKIAEGFFRNNPELDIDFRKNTLILNKTPIHTAKTKELVGLCRQGGKKVTDIVAESQKYMADLAFQLQQLFSCEIWIVGYGELKPKGIFENYKNHLYTLYTKNGKKDDFMEKVFVYQHFSMNRFSIDLKTKSSSFEKGRLNECLSLKENLHKVGKLHRNDIFGI